ncbi:MAG: LptF/LptG family permease [Spirochaetaceae bacterium]|jgi:lipopolysaccharide export system permease protein|nr:LptF/LptG family permease [Spirochaetaceae bacterium]
MKNELVKNGYLSRTMFFYVLSEVLFAFFIWFLFFFFVFFVNQFLLLARQILEKKVPLQQVISLLVYSFPSIIAMSMPFAALLGTLMTIGRMASENEVLVMLTSGMSYKNIFIPVFLSGFLFSLVSFGVNDVLLPMGTIEYYKLYRRILVSTPALEIESNSVKRFKDTVLITGNVTNNEIEDMLILDKTSEGERRVIMAKKAEFIDDGTAGINLDFNDAFIHASKETERQDYDYASSGFLSYRIQQNDIIQNETRVSAREMSSRDVYYWIKKREMDIDDIYSERNKRTLETALSLEGILRNGPGGRNWNQRGSQLGILEQQKTEIDGIKKDQQLSLFRLEFFKKFSVPMGAFALVFLALPIGAGTKKGGQVVGLILGMFIAVIYWAFMLIGQNMGIKLGYSPFWTMWLPDLLSITIGTGLCLRQIKR